MPKPAPGEIIENEASEKGQTRSFGRMMHFPGVCGAFERFVGVFGTQTFSSDSQLSLSCVANSKKGGKFSTTSTAGIRLVRFSTGWTDNLHRAFKGSKPTGRNAGQIAIKVVG
jgi:hypothetical protein